MRKQTLTALAAISVFTLAGCSAETLNITPEASSTEANVEANTQVTESASPEVAPTLDAPLTDVEIVLMALMGPEGEYAAAASYEAVLEEFGDVEPYATIYEAELRHADALIRQLERLGEDVPENPYTGQIPAPEDLQSAAKAWAEGEVANVELYDSLLAKTDDEQLVKVLTNLRAASADSHLPAFEAAAENGGALDDMSGFGHSSSESDQAMGQGHGGKGRQHGKTA